MNTRVDDSSEDSITDKIKELLDQVRALPSHRNYYYVYKQIQKLQSSRADIFEGSTIKIALLSSFTIDLLSIYLDVNCRLLGLNPEIYIGPFNQYQQEILKEDSKLYSFEPDLILINIQLESVLPQEFITEFPRLSNQDISSQFESIVPTLTRSLDLLAERSKATILVSNFIIPSFSPFGVLESKADRGFGRFYQEVNTELLQRYRSSNQIYIFDLDTIASNFGKSNVTNQAMYYRGSILFSDPFLPVLANQYEGYIKALTNLNRKCIVLDLDNTLWGGIIGEDGIEGIKLNTNYPGNEFVDFQRCLLTYYNRGIILAINSKNNYEDAIEALQNHPSMILREEHFASMQINWRDKVENLLEIASEINIGLDSLVFIDDNPVERERVKQALPDVLVLDLPENPAHYRQALESMNDFNTFTLTSEDLKRGEMYVARRKREDLKENLTSMEDFIASLEITATIKPADEFTLPRITSLINRTNQFNLTTRRYTEPEVESLIADFSDTEIYSLQVTDKFGDEGIVGVVMIKYDDNSVVIDNFLMSCRVIGRKIETVLLQKIMKVAMNRGVTKLIGEFIPSKKNKLVKEFYSNHNFTLLEEQNGKTKWTLDLTDSEIKYPEFITVVED
jgi:FkbH-like protein